MRVWEVKLFLKYVKTVEAINSSKIEGADDMGMISLCKKVDSGKWDEMDWFFELKKRLPQVYKVAFFD